MNILRLASFIVVHAAWLGSSPARDVTTFLLEKLHTYEQGKPLSDLIDTRQAVFAGTQDEAVRALRERELLAFIASDAHPQAKAIAIDWLGILGTAAAVPALVAARGNPALEAVATTALEHIPGPEAKQALAAKPPKTCPAPTTNPKAAEVERFLAKPGKENDDAQLAAAIASHNDMLAGAALRRIRAGSGSPSLAAKLLANTDELPPPRRSALFEALATRREAIDGLHAALVDRARAGEPQQRADALMTLGRILRPDDLPLVLDCASDTADSVISKAAAAALTRAIDPAIDTALTTHTASGPRAPAAIQALAARHTTKAVDPLWQSVTSPDPAIAAAAFQALGTLIPPADLPGLLEKLRASHGGKQAEQTAKLFWNVLRRHPDPAAAADMVEKAAATAPAGLKDVMLRHATRIRPKNQPQAAALDLPDHDDLPALSPDSHERLVYLNCGSLTEARGGGIRIQRTTGDAYQFGPVAHALATVDFGKEITYEITGLEPDTEYVLGFSAWDADLNGRRQSLAVNQMKLLPDFAPIAYQADKPTYMRAHLPLANDLTTSGKATVTMTPLAGPNAVISELWLLRRKADAPRARRVVILTGDDHPAHLWRLTGPEFASTLRADPRLEVTITESPSLLDSPALSAYDVVFLHFKNYQNRLPTSSRLWENLDGYIRNGGGLVVAHFGCGAMQEWNGFANIAGRVWDPKLRAHDPHGEFHVRILPNQHPATTQLKDFTTIDELYTCLAGDTDIRILAEATSKVDHKDYPMAFALEPGKGRVFHCTLGHDLQSLKGDGPRRLYLQGTLWAAGLLENKRRD